LSFSAALADELKDTNITITVLLPGATDTDFFHKAKQEETVVYQETQLADPVDVAKDGYNALKNGENKIISGAKTKMHVFMSDLLGARLGAANMKRQMKPSKKPRTKKEPSHAPSREERQDINRETGASDGDR
jgi:short-subunit dehydrogenase